MVYNVSSPTPGRPGLNPEESGVARNCLPTAVKILIAGGFGAGKTTLVGAVSEIEPLVTEERLTIRGEKIDNLAGIEGKEATTVALDFGRITLASDLILFLFGTPGQERFWFMWKELSAGALGAVVLVDTRSLSKCFPVIDFLEMRRIPFVVAINRFESADRYSEDEVRDALGLSPHRPIVSCDARDRISARKVLIALVRHLLALPIPNDHADPIPEMRNSR
jgi:signal recognition particle receptor subunit beta